MTKTTLALAAALLAGTTLTGTANAGGIRLGFGFPLGSFVAHPTQSYAGDGYGYRRHCDRERATRRVYRAEATPVRKIKRVRKVDVAETKPVTAPVVKTAKLEDKLQSNPATTTEIAKTTDITTSSTTPTGTTTNTPAASTAKTDAPKTDTVATADKTSTDAKSDAVKPATETKQVCRRYSAAIAGLVDVPCDE